MYKHSKKIRKNFSKKTKKQTGAGIFSITPKSYMNLTYKKSGYVTPKLTCSQCKHDVFRHHTALHGSRMREFVTDSDLFDKKYNIFVCYNCGFMMNYSGDISYDNTKA